ncbi:uncharacterized protein PV09_09643 [Verruconis gallopava]|uniref:Uncharacterized protein n=1 Tax=Verruconis gallopava TaxID=253628 RepID=A0A0D1YD08_9PEZI|nr:uncharacterized protein PV09_09643 [Verruconis gallopava]KIV98556.1 hypothetical protein PV09_09643 [Verruconis gallopava]
MSVHSTIDANGHFTAAFEPWFLPEYDDDAVRADIPCYPPNIRQWKFKSEGCMRDYFHTEVVNPVLAAWSRQPIILHQSEVSPLDQRSTEKVDDFYTINLSSGHEIPFVVGEYKKNLIVRDEWQSGALTSDSQQQLGRELRGYCVKYMCPQGYCFDGETCILWQFRAVDRKDMEKLRCGIDIWVLPRGFSTTTYRYALNRLFSQALRRCQGSLAYPTVDVSGYIPETRPFFSGEPLFRIPGSQELQNLNQYNYSRAMDITYGAFFWKHGEEDLVLDGRRVWDTAPLWGTT